MAFRKLSQCRLFHQVKQPRVILIYGVSNPRPQHLTAFMKYLIILLNPLPDPCPFLPGWVPRQPAPTLQPYKCQRLPVIFTSDGLKEVLNAGTGSATSPLTGESLCSENIIHCKFFRRQ